jgi:hypothetical protein
MRDLTEFHMHVQIYGKLHYFQFYFNIMNGFYISSECLQREAYVYLWNITQIQWPINVANRPCSANQANVGCDGVIYGTYSYQSRSFCSTAAQRHFFAL